MAKSPPRPPHVYSETFHLRLPPQTCRELEARKKAAEQRAGVPVKMADILRDLLKRGMKEDE